MMRLSKKVDRRALAYAICMARLAEEARIHAVRDRCGMCYLFASGAMLDAMSGIPAQLLGDKDWWHKHVDMPAARQAARTMEGRQHE